MRLVLDTHVLLWWLRDHSKLGPRARHRIASNGNTVLVSVGSFWEISIKHRTGKLPWRGSEIWREATDQGFQPMGLTPQHLSALEVLAKVGKHRDPFDHLILAQAAAEDATLMTADEVLSRYGIPCVGVG